MNILIQILLGLLALVVLTLLILGLLAIGSVVLNSRDRRLALAAEDETNDELLEVKEAVDRGDLIQGPYGQVHYACFDAYCDGRLGAVCDSCKSLLGVTA